MHQITVYQRNGKSGHSVQMSKLISFSRGLKERQSALGIWIPCCHGWKGKVTVSRLAAELGSQALLRSLQCSVYSVFPRMLGTAPKLPLVLPISARRHPTRALGALSNATTSRETLNQLPPPPSYLSL